MIQEIQDLLDAAEEFASHVAFVRDNEYVVYSLEEGIPARQKLMDAAYAYAKYNDATKQLHTELQEWHNGQVQG